MNQLQLIAAQVNAISHAVGQARASLHSQTVRLIDQLEQHSSSPDSQHMADSAKLEAALRELEDALKTIDFVSRRHSR